MAYEVLRVRKMDIQYWTAEEKFSAHSRIFTFASGCSDLKQHASGPPTNLVKVNETCREQSV